MQADPVQAGHQLIDRNNPGIAAALSEDVTLGNAYTDALQKREADATWTGKVERCILDGSPGP